MNILTFDIEEWYIYEKYPKGGRGYYGPIIEDYLLKILDLLDKNEVKATFFCLGIIARKDPHIIKLIADRGQEIGCHSDSHHWLANHNPETFRKDTELAINSLENLTGKKVNSYRAPAFSIGEKTLWALDILAELGIKNDCSIFPANRSFGGFPSFPFDSPAIIKTKSGIVKEFPLSTSNIAGKRFVFSGGGYFRLFPYSFIKKLMHRSHYNMSYFHIRDFDQKQKKVVSWRYFQSYYGVNGALKKFEKLLNDFSFVSVEQADCNYNWEKAPKLSV